MDRDSRPGGDTDERSLVLDELAERLERFAAFRDPDSPAAASVLAEFGGTKGIDSDILTELSAKVPLAIPDRFLEAHAFAMHALEVLDRNGARRVRVPGVWPLRPVAETVVQLVTRAIVRSYQGMVIDRLRDLYSRRLAWCPPKDPSRGTLLRARRDSDRATAAYKHKANGLPTFLLGGVAASGIGSGLRGAAQAAGGSVVAAVVATAVIFALLAAASWAILRGATVARHRIHITIEAPLKALYETIGHCGLPPKDNSRIVALYAILLTIVAGLVVPAGVVYVATRV
jgi:hypothetical protein